MDSHYSSDEEEVFFGSLADSEIYKRRQFLGSNYNSPVTPRPSRLNHGSSGLQVSLPDVLPDVRAVANTSTPVPRHLSDGNENCKAKQHHLPLDDSLDDVIVLDASGCSNSIITLSDDESFIENEKTCSNKSTRPESINQSMKIGSLSICEISNSSSTAEISNQNESNDVRKDFGSDYLTAKDKSIQNSDVHISEKCIQDSNVHISEKGNSLNENIDFTNEIYTKRGISPGVELHQEISSDKEYVVCNSVTAEDESLHESAMNNSENGILGNDSITNLETDTLHNTVDKCFELKSNMKNISNIVQDIDAFIGDASEIQQSFQKSVDNITVGQSPAVSDNPESLNLSSCDLASRGKGHETSSFDESKILSSKETSELQTNVSIFKEAITNAGEYGKHFHDMSALSNLEFSLNGVTDSILNISHGSSLPSPQDTYQSVRHNPNLYEDISCDGETFSNITDISNSEGNLNQEDLHMSVDEVDHQRQGFSDNFVVLSSLENSVNISQPGDYKSCVSGHSSYRTAFDKTLGENLSTSEQSSSFKNYRDVSSQLDICNEVDTISIKSNEDNSNETNFEMVLQNRQNSFNGTPASKKSENNKEEGKSKVMSKLPVYQNSKSFLRPPKFCVKPDTLKTSSYRFAKQISKAGNEKQSLNHLKPETCKIPEPSSIKKHTTIPSTKEKKIPLEKEKTFTKVPINTTTPRKNILTPKQFSSLTKSKIPTHSHLAVNKSPAQYLNKTPAKTPARTPAKTPVQNISGIPRVVKSESKLTGNRILTPSRDFNTIGPSSGAGAAIPSKNKFKNIMSPIRAYIRCSPPTSQRKAKISEEPEISEELQAKLENVSPTMSPPKAMQKLKYENVQGQENVDPNMIDPTRDTLPCKILEPSLKVFWKEREQPQPQLPKMGEKLTKILASSPKMKITIHEGRVNQTPTSKGILVPNNDNKETTSSDILSVDSLPSEELNGRISVRIQKTVQRP